MLKSSSHVWHMVLVAGVAVVAVWLGAAWSTAFLFSVLICAAMLGALVWFLVRSTCDDAEKFVPGGASRNLDAHVPTRSFDERRRREPFAPPEPDRR